MLAVGYWEVVASTTAYFTLNPLALINLLKKIKCVCVWHEKDIIFLKKIIIILLPNVFLCEDLVLGWSSCNHAGNDLQSIKKVLYIFLQSNNAKNVD